MAHGRDSHPGGGELLACAVIELADAIGTLTETLIHVSGPPWRYGAGDEDPAPVRVLRSALRDLVDHHTRLMVANGWPTDEARRWAEEWFEGGE